METACELLILPGAAALPSGAPLNVPVTLATGETEALRTLVNSPDFSSISDSVPLDVRYHVTWGEGDDATAQQWLNSFHPTWQLKLFTFAVFSVTAALHALLASHLANLPPAISSIMLVPADYCLRQATSLTTPVAPVLVAPSRNKLKAPNRKMPDAVPIPIPVPLPESSVHISITESILQFGSPKFGRESNPISASSSARKSAPDSPKSDSM